MAEFGRTNAGAIVTAIATALRFFGGRIDRTLRRILDGLREGLIALGTELAKFATQTGLLMARVVGLLRRFWRSVLLPLLQRLDRWADVVQKWLRSTFGPIIEALLWLRRKIFELYDRWLRPIFDTIDVIRRVLSILSLLQLDFARKLDAKLAALEERLRRPLELALAKVNEAIDWLNDIRDGHGFFQRVILLRTLARDMARISGIWHTARSTPLTDEERRTSPNAPGLKPPENVLSDFQAYMVTGQSPHRAELDEALADLRLRLKSV